jgi:CubicO group peptidase (beta-lactamase class C family)
MHFEAYHGVNAAQHQANFNRLSSQGYRMISLSVYGDAGSPLYAAVWVQRSGPAWVAVHGVDSAAYQSFFNTWGAKGFVPVLVSATGPFANAVFAAVFEQGIEGSWQARHGVPAGPVNQAGSFNYLNSSFAAQNLYIRSFAIYGTSNSRYYIAVWHSNPGYVKWHVHPADPAANYQSTFNAETQLAGYGLHGYRPAYVALSADQTYCSVFKDDVVGPWAARHGMTAGQYQTEFNEQTAAGNYPICVQGGGTTANAVYAAIFAKQDIPSPRQWTATGAAVPSLAAFDNAFKQFMQTNAVRAAQFTLSKNGSVLLARAYTWAEPGYRITQPSDRFLLASCSKMFCEQAIQTLYDAGALKPPMLLIKPNGSEVPIVGDLITGNSSGATGTVKVVTPVVLPRIGKQYTVTLTSVTGTFTASDNAATMNLSGGTVAVISYTPSTAAYPLLGFSHPTDVRSDMITIQQLLDHEGGYNDGTNSNLPSAPDPTYNMRNIAVALGLNQQVGKADIARYMYQQPLQYTPGTNSAYSNYGYLLLSAIVEKVTSMDYFNYVQQKVLAPLGITEVLLSSTEAQQRDPSEAICEDQGLGLDPIKINSNLQIPAVYGGDGQIKEVAAACAGLAASATALTRFIHTNLVWGNGPRPNPGNWSLGRTGSTPGTSTEAFSLGSGIDWAYAINTRDLPPQTPLPLASLATTIGNLITSTPGLA